MKYVASSSLPVSVEDAFAYHERHGALQRLVPPWESVEVERTDNSLAVGSEVVLKTSVFGGETEPPSCKTSPAREYSKELTTILKNLRDFWDLRKLVSKGSSNEPGS